MIKQERNRIRLEVPQGILSEGLYYVAEYIFQYRLGLNLEVSESPLVQSIVLTAPPSLETFDFGLPVRISQMENMRLRLTDIDFVKAKTPVIFADSALPLKFDIFSGVFFFLSRYEEYVIEDRDSHGRFCASYSLQNQWGTLKRPLVDIWIHELKIALKGLFSSLDFGEERFDAINTYDIDQPFALRGKPIHKVVGRVVLDVFGIKLHSLKRKFHYFFGRADPFDNWLECLEQTRNPHVFFLMIGNTQFDKNTQVDTQAFSNLVVKVKEKAEVGLHPSYYGEERNSLGLEKEKLEDICGETINTSRQHYLRFDMPKTPRVLMENSLQTDYSMGFPDSIGFRAGTSRSFSFFDIEKQKRTGLQLVPFCVMDVTLRNYLKLTPVRAIDSIKSLIDELKACNGLFVSLWHNESLSEIDGWRGWMKVHEQMLEYQKNQL